MCFQYRIAEEEISGNFYESSVRIIIYKVSVSNLYQRCTRDSMTITVREFVDDSLKQKFFSRKFCYGHNKRPVYKIEGNLSR
jgi:hypothetical protein